MLKLFITLSMLSWLLDPTSVLAQADEFIVTLRDERGTGIAGVTVTIVTNADEHVATQTTDASGQALFSRLGPMLVRVRISGYLLDGTALIQRGDDANGVVFLLDGSVAQLDLRVESDGGILPDPASMITLDTSSSQEQPHIPDAPRAGTVMPTTNTGAASNALANASTELAPVSESSAVPVTSLFLVLGLFVALAAFVSCAHWMRQRELL